MDYPYSDAPSRLPDILEKIRVVGVPDKATTRWLSVIGFKTKADRSSLKVLKFIGLIDEKGIPSEAWLAFRGSNYNTILGQCIRYGYSELFGIFPNAYELEQKELESFFATKTKSGAQVVSRLVRTFETLCSMADFKNIPDVLENSIDTTEPPLPLSQSTEIKNSVVEAAPIPESMIIPSSPTVQPTLHIDIQIHISPDAAPDQIDQIFASMAKHLYRK